MAILSLPDRDVYISSGMSPQMGEIASAATAGAPPSPDLPGGAIHAGGPAPSPLSGPVWVWFWVVLAFLGVAYLFQHRSPAETFKNPKVSFIAMVTIWASWAVVQMGMRAGAAASEKATGGPNSFSRLIKGL